MSNELAPFQAQEVGLTQTQMDRYGIGNPEQLVALAREVNKYVNTNQLSQDIQGKQYVLVEGWQFAGSLLGLVGKIVSYENKSSYEPVEYEITKKEWVNRQPVYTKVPHKTKEYKYFAEAAFYDRQGVEVSKAYAMCSNEEAKKNTFDEYAIFSMAQTRALGKAARMSFAFLIKAAGYEPTPAEEMPDKDDDRETEIVDLPKEIEEMIYTFEDGETLANWANGQVKYHQNIAFLHKVREQIKKLNNESK